MGQVKKKLKRFDLKRQVALYGEKIGCNFRQIASEIISLNYAKCLKGFLSVSKLSNEV